LTERRKLASFSANANATIPCKRHQEQLRSAALPYHTVGQLHFFFGTNRRGFRPLLELIKQKKVQYRQETKNKRDRAGQQRENQGTRKERKKANN